MVYPASSMTAHVSDVPNHQVGRTTSFSMRGTVAMAGMLGYELDLSKMTDDETKCAKEQIELYKNIREVITFGDLYRLSETDRGNYYAWMYISENKNKAVVSAVVNRGVPNPPRVWIKLKGLDENAVYMMDGKKYFGSNLMNAGIEISLSKDYNNYMYVLEKV